jgi:hypothetical protein
MKKLLPLLAVLSFSTYATTAPEDNCQSLGKDARSAIGTNDADIAVLVLRDDKELHCLPDVILKKLQTVIENNSKKDSVQYGTSNVNDYRDMCRNALLKEGIQTTSKDWIQINAYQFQFSVTNCIIDLHNDGTSATIQH